MNIYVQFDKYARFLNLKPTNPNATGFSYIRLSDNTLQPSTSSFSNYVDTVTSPNAAQYYFYTTASTPEELYSLHPELFI